MVDLFLQGCSEVLKNGGPCVESPPTFRTGLGKSVTVKQFSIAKALSTLGGIDFGAGSQDHDRDGGCGFFLILFSRLVQKKWSVFLLLVHSEPRHCWG